MDSHTLKFLLPHAPPDTTDQRWEPPLEEDEQMKITNVRTIKLAATIPPELRWRTDAGIATRHEAAIISVETDEGLVGYGEAKGSPPVIEAIVENRLRPHLIGQDPSRVEYLWESMYSGGRLELALAHGRAYAAANIRGEVMCAISGVDIALWDLLGKSLDLPLHRLLGGGLRDHVRAYASGGWAGPGKAADEIGGYLAKGYTAAKIRVGGLDNEDFPARSVARLEEIREAIGSNVDLMMDAHGALTRTQASRLAHAVEDLDIRWFEEPVAVSEDLAGLAEVRARTTIPIATGENEQTRYAFATILEAKAADVIQPDLAIAGGITESRRIAALAQAQGVTVEPHTWGSGVLWAASLQFVAATPNSTIIEVAQAYNPLLTDLVTTEIGAGPDGYCEVPTRPGLGIELQPDVEVRYAWS